MFDPFDWIAGGLDRAIQRVAIGQSPQNAPAPPARTATLSEIRARVRLDAYFVDPDAFFVPPESAPSPEELRLRDIPGGRVVEWRWRADYEPFFLELAPVLADWTANHTAVARAFLHDDGPRPTVILVHGYFGGDFRVEERIWPIEWLHRIGLDVVLFTLPHHGARVAGLRPMFPSDDPRMTIDGFRQSIFDLRSLRAYLARAGAPAIGVMGMSLGGYTGTLLATIERDLAFVVPFVPLASIAEFAAEGEWIVGTISQRRRQRELLDETLAVVSPLARPARVLSERCLVVGARGDRITPVTHAERIASHLEAPLVLFSGGHVLQVGRGDGFRAVGKLLGGLGLLRERP